MSRKAGEGIGVTVATPSPGPVATLPEWIAAAHITEGPVFRAIAREQTFRSWKVDEALFLRPTVQEFVTRTLSPALC